MKNSTKPDAEKYRLAQAQKLLDWFNRGGSEEELNALFDENGKIKI